MPCHGYKPRHFSGGIVRRAEVARIGEGLTVPPDLAARFGMQPGDRVLINHVPDSKKRFCLCCGDSFIVHFPGHARYCPGCRVQAVRIKRQAAIVGALWEGFPEIAIEVVSRLKEEGKWCE